MLALVGWFVSWLCYLPFELCLPFLQGLPSCAALACFSSLTAYVITPWLINSWAGHAMGMKNGGFWIVNQFTRFASDYSLQLPHHIQSLDLQKCISKIWHNTKELSLKIKLRIYFIFADKSRILRQSVKHSRNTLAYIIWSFHLKFKANNI